MYDPILYGDIATWLTGIATIALFIVALVQINHEREARIKTEIKTQEQKIREQAQSISCWIEATSSDNSMISIAILNQSAQPIYNVIASVFRLDHSGDRSLSAKPPQLLVDIVPSGQWYGFLSTTPLGHPGHSRIGVEIAFKDILGLNWIRRPNGELNQLEKSTLEHYQIELPANWQRLSKTTTL